MNGWVEREQLNCTKCYEDGNDGVALVRGAGSTKQMNATTAVDAVGYGRSGRLDNGVESEAQTLQLRCMNVALRIERGWTPVWIPLWLCVNLA